MADIIIKGMGMPKTCNECPLNVSIYTYDGGDETCALKAWDGYSEQPKTTRHPDCPLFPLPEGHGRLGDLDALVSKYTEEINKLEEWAKNQEKEGRLERFRACHLRSAYLAEAKLNIEAAPTIVPAEGGGEDG